MTDDAWAYSNKSVRRARGSGWFGTKTSVRQLGLSTLLMMHPT